MLSKEYLTCALITVGIFTLYMAVLNILRPNKNNRLKNAAEDAYALGMTEENSTVPALVQFYEKYVAGGKRDEALRKKLSQEMVQAGIQSPFAIEYYLLFQTVAQPLLLLLAAYTLYSCKDSTSTTDLLIQLIVSAMLCLLGFRGHKLYINNRRQKRASVLNASFSEILDLLLVCIESGLGLDAALNRVCKEFRTMHPEIIEELDRTRLELTMLGDRVIALQNLADRSVIQPIKTLVSALIQTEKFGTSLTDTLRVLSEEQRIVRIYTAEQKAARIPVLITIPLIIFIMPAFIMILIGPPLVKVAGQGGILNNVPLTTSR